MGAFEYVAVDQSGKRSKGLLEGDTPKHVRQILRDRNLLPHGMCLIKKTTISLPILQKKALHFCRAFFL